MIEIKFKGRGGQGAVIASEILGKGLFSWRGNTPNAFHSLGENAGVLLLSDFYASIMNPFF